MLGYYLIKQNSSYKGVTERFSEKKAIYCAVYSDPYEYIDNPNYPKPILD